MYFVTVAASATIVMAAAFVLNAMLGEGWLSHEHEGQAEALKRARAGRTQARCNEA